MVLRKGVGSSPSCRWDHSARTTTNLGTRPYDTPETSRLLVGWGQFREFRAS